MIHYDVVKSYIEANKGPLGIFQTSFTNSMASLVYSAYLKSFKERNRPANTISVPTIHSVSTFLTDSDFINNIKFSLLDNMKYLLKNDNLYKEFNDLSEFKLLNDIEFRLIFDEHMVKNLSSQIPRVISQKFQLDGEGSQVFKEDRDIRLFDGIIHDDYYIYLANELILNVLVNDENVHKEYEDIDSDVLYMANDDMLSVNNVNAMCPIYFNGNTFNLYSTMQILGFVTNTEAYEMNDKHIMLKDDRRSCKWKVNINRYNDINLFQLFKKKGI